MANAAQIREQLRNWLNGRISLRQFEDWFVPSTWDVHRENDTEAEALAEDIEMHLSEFSGGELNVDRLANLLRQLANASHVIHVDWREANARFFVPVQAGNSAQVDLEPRPWRNGPRLIRLCPFLL